MDMFPCHCLFQTPSARVLPRGFDQDILSQPQADRDGQASEFAEVYDASEAHTRMQQELKVMPRRHRLTIPS